MAINPKLGIYRSISHWSELVATVYTMRRREIDKKKRTQEMLSEKIPFPKAMPFAKSFSRIIDKGKESYRDVPEVPEPSDVFIFTNQQKRVMDGIVVDEALAGKEERVDESEVRVVELATNKTHGVRVVPLTQAFSDRNIMTAYLFKSNEVAVASLLHLLHKKR